MHLVGCNRGCKASARAHLTVLISMLPYPGLSVVNAGDNGCTRSHFSATQRVDDQSFQAANYHLQRRLWQGG